jgi:diguanylate cyclase (GGDEF)-like protein
MNLSSWITSIVRADRFDWRRRDNRDAVIILCIAVLAFVVGTIQDIALKFFQFGIDHADWNVDDIIFVVFVLGIAMIAYEVRRYQDVSHEIKARTSAEAEARKLARHDPLTGLPNGRNFEERLEECLSQAGAVRRVAVLILDLDGFHAVNDTYGHRIGNKALSEFSLRVSTVLRPDSYFARLGGDEFAIIKQEIDSIEDPAHLARRIAAAIIEPFSIDGVTVQCSVGIGIAIAPGDGGSPDELLRHADHALRRAKAAGRSSVCFFEPEMDAHVERRVGLERELRAAIAADALRPCYQPLVSLGEDRIIGFEALARWQSGTLGHVGPDVFIPLAEDTGLINELGNQLLRQACLEAEGWSEPLTLAFNISPVQLRDPTLGLRILSILAETGLDPRRLEIEITESALVESTGTAQATVDQLRQAGVRVALDDFGTGYATLSQLLSFNVDKVKIDRSFVSRIGTGKHGHVIVDAVLGIAKGFGLTATAEGVENATQLNYLKAKGCTEGQGYLFSKPVTAADIPKLLNYQKLGTAVA